MQKIVYIGVEQLHPHPDNPRKDLGDLTELAESIKAKGVLQNLTVVPVEDGYRVIIGHRRHAAAQLAGLAELPCVVTDMSPQEQFETMMVENIQRSDLTVYEQAEGFQMMLDMGGTVETVAQKTGFSQSTVRSRVKLLSLDKEKFKKAEMRGATLTDYLRLNEIVDPDVRNKVLDHIGTSNFNQKLTDALADQRFKKEKAAFVKTLQESDWCKERTDETYGYQGEYQHYKTFDRWNKKPIPKPKDTDVATYIYLDLDCQVSIYRKGPQVAKSPEEEKKERYRKKADKIEKKLKSVTQTHKEMREAFMQSFTAFSSNEMDIQAWATKTIISGGGYSTVDVELMSKIASIPLEKEKKGNFLDQELWNKMLFHHPLRALCVATYAKLEHVGVRYYTLAWNNDLYCSTAKHQKDAALDLLYEGLCSLGYEMSDEEIQMQSGSHPLFKELADLITEFKKEKV